MGRRFLAVALASLVVSATGVDHASAQDPVRSGFWAEAGAGTGTVRSACSACGSVTVAYGTANHLRIGGSLSPRVLIGIEFFALSSSDLDLEPSGATVDAENGSLGPIVMWYVGRSGFFLKGGVGLARGTYTVQADGGPVTAERTGSSISFSIGYDIRLGSRFALTANLGTYATAVGDVRLDGMSEPVDDLIAMVYEAGVGLTLR